jgi:hypothetical protein
MPPASSCSWLLDFGSIIDLTMNSISPVSPLDARRMCSSSERFIRAKNHHPFVLWHENGERAALPHPGGVLPAVFQHLDYAFGATPLDDIYGKPIY